MNTTSDSAISWYQSQWLDVKWAIITCNVKSIIVDNWIAEWVIIASNTNSVRVDDWTAKWVIIANNVLVSV